MLIRRKDRYSNKMSEKLISKVISKWNKRGIGFDIGANVGDYTVQMSYMFDEVYAFEPYLVTSTWLEQMICPVYSNVKVINQAVSNFNGECKLYMHAVRSTEHSISEAIAENVGWGYNKNVHMSVPCVTLDTFVQETGKIPSFIKCDVEGAEVEVFEGARGILENYGPAIALEIHKTIDILKLYQLFLSCGYSVPASADFPKSRVSAHHCYLIKNKK
jgi:FkbM family methyltransferase